MEESQHPLRRLMSQNINLWPHNRAMQDPKSWRDILALLEFASPFVLKAIILLVTVLFTVRLLMPRTLRRLLWPFRPFIDTQEAESLLQTKGTQASHILGVATSRWPRWRSAIFALTGLCQTLAWIFMFCWALPQLDLWIPHPREEEVVLTAFVAVPAWFYATLRPAVHPTSTPPYDLLTIYSLLLLHSVGDQGYWAYELYVYHMPYKLDPIALFAAINLVSTLFLLIIVLNMPLAILGLSSGIPKEAIGTTISPEDYTTLWKWITFSWIMPLSRKDSLYNEQDVWNLSPTMATSVLYRKYADVGKLYRDVNGKVSLSSFFRHWWACNSFDIIRTLSLTTLSIVFEFASPLFLKIILDCISDLNQATNSLEARRLRARAFVYAIAAFVFALAKAGADLNQLFYGRRASVRTRNEVMVAIYDKALRRRDVVAPASTGEEKGDDPKDADATADQKTSKKEERGQDGADIGKLVNIMSSDAGTLEQMISMLFLFYGAPIQLAIAFTFLYYLLGWAAFAGVFVFFAVSPLNHAISRRATRIFANRQEARDKKMTVLNEMISEIKFIKFMANEEGWIKRALSAREKELKWIRQRGYINILFSLLWDGTPIAVSIFSLWAYIWGGGRLSVAIAFTAVRLFNMVTRPLHMLPMVLVQYLQLKISMKRIADFLSEPEVDGDVSSLKKDEIKLGREATDETMVDEGKIGITNGFFLWSPPAGSNEKQDQAPPKQDARWRINFWSKRTTDEPLAVTEVNTASDAPPVTSGESSTPISRLATPSSTARQFELRDINVLFPAGELSLVTGPTASGKTALLRALLGEMYTMRLSSSETLPATKIFLPKNPTVLDESTGMRDYISYAAQTPWLEHLTIKENILFGSEFDQRRYEQVLECCALKPDLEILEDGDETEIGERGVTLSGGQKARVALARAVYAPTRYVLLDDPLSAVDSHTARFLFNRLFRGPLLAKRTVILVTHHVSLVLSGAGYLVRMSDGRIETQGSISELRERGVLQEITSQAIKGQQTEAAAVGAHPAGKTEDQDKDKKVAKKLVEEEERARGSVKWSVYLTYIRASTYSMWTANLSLTMLRVLIQIGEKGWLQIWGTAYETAPAVMVSNTTLYFQHPNSSPFRFSALLFGQPVTTRTLPSANEHPFFYIRVFALIGVVLLIVEMLGTLVLVLAQYRASRALFGRVLDSLTRATVRWHETTPTGRILNRLSKDFDVIDTTIGFSFAESLACLSTILLCVVTVVIISPLFIFPGIIIGCAYVWVSMVYIRTSRPLKRLESTALSPIFASFRTTLEGLASIRAFSAERRFLDRMIRDMDVTTKCFWAARMMNRRSLLAYDFLGALAVLVVMLFVVAYGGNNASQVVSMFGGKMAAFQGKEGSSSGLEGLVIFCAVYFTSSVYWACHCLTQLELDLNSVERITEYTILPQEPPAIIESSRPPAYWPSSSSASDFITVEDLVIKYAPNLPAVLHGISFRIGAQERVGLVGRTGSGKSTLATAFCRFVEPEKGRIVIDGIDISTIGLHDLRSRVTFIPQDSVLFSGTVRDNLDPFQEHTDDACLDVLRRAHLVDQSLSSTRPASVMAAEGSVASVPDSEDPKQAVVKLDSVVTSGGSNFSHGQRQLIALARALLRKTSVIIMDEATSSIDFETDTKIQETLQEEFGTSCVITIAHRLQTIMDYDRVIVMDSGTIVENGPPSELMANTGGVFHSMCVQARLARES